MKKESVYIKVCEVKDLKRADNTYCSIIVDKKKHLTKTVPGTAAIFNQEFMSEASKDSKITIDVFTGKDELVGSVNLKAKDLTKMVDSWYPLAKKKLIGGGKAGQLHVKAMFGDLDSLPKPKKMTIDDFDLMTVVGKGTFGKVMQVRKKDTGRIYAMKVIRKALIIEKNQIERTLAEKEVLKNIDNGFLVNLKFSFQSDDKLYFILDFVNGGELFFHLQRQGKFSEEQVRFFSSELILGLKALHENGIVYRDLKPENILLDEKGHIRITDFGLVKGMEKVSSDKTNSFVGTPEYLAPEVLQGQGYGKDVDWWSLGILIYEMLTGLPPYFDDNVNVMYMKILKADLVFPDFVSPDAVDIITKMLDRDPSKRLGHGEADTQDLMKHPFFKSVDWDAVAAKTIEPPYQIDVGGKEDTSQFEPDFTSRPAIDSVVTDNPINDSDQTHFAGFTYIEESNMTQPST